MMAMEQPGRTATAERFGWFCVRSKPKSEHIAAAHLRKLSRVKVFNPMVRYRKATRNGPAWYQEALFPGYLFAEFDWASSLRAVQATNAVTGVVRFGDQWPMIDGSAIEQLRELVGAEELREFPEVLEPGMDVVVSGGAMDGICGVVQRILPARRRVAVLMEFLGRQTLIELNSSELVPLDSTVRARDFK